jgi:integrase
LTREQEVIYLEFAPELLRNAAISILDTGLGPGEALSLERTDTHPDYLEVREGKTTFRKRKIKLTDRVRKMLERGLGQTESRFVFPGRNPAKADARELARAFAPGDSAQAQATRSLCFILSKAHGTDPNRGRGCRCFRHYADCWAFFGHHYTTVCSSLFGGVECGD